MTATESAKQVALAARVEVATTVLVDELRRTFDSFNRLGEAFYDSSFEIKKTALIFRMIDPEISTVSRWWLRKRVLLMDYQKAISKWWRDAVNDFPIGRDLINRFKRRKVDQQLKGYADKRRKYAEFIEVYPPPYKLDQIVNEPNEPHVIRAGNGEVFWVGSKTLRDSQVATKLFCELLNEQIAKFVTEKG